MNLFRQQKFSIRKFNVGIFSALIATVTFISTNPTTASAAEQNQPAQNQPAQPADANTQPNANAGAQANPTAQPATPANQGQPAAQPASQGGQANPAGGAAQPNTQPAGQGNQADPNNAAQAQPGNQAAPANQAGQGNNQATPNNNATPANQTQPANAPAAAQPAAPVAANAQTQDPNASNTGEGSINTTLTFDDPAISTDENRQDPIVTVTDKVNGYSLINNGKIGFVNSELRRSDMFDKNNPQNYQARGNVAALGRVNANDSTDHGNFNGISKTVNVKPDSELIINFTTMQTNSKQGATNLVIKDAKKNTELATVNVAKTGTAHLFKVPTDADRLDLQFIPDNTAVADASRITTNKDGYKYYSFIDNVGLFSGSHLYVKNRDLAPKATNNKEFTINTEIGNNGNFGASLKADQFKYEVTLPQGVTYVNDSLTTTFPNGNEDSTVLKNMTVNYDQNANKVTFTSQGVTTARGTHTKEVLFPDKSLKLSYKVNVANIDTPKNIDFNEKLTYRTASDVVINNAQPEVTLTADPFSVAVEMNKDALQQQVNSQVDNSHYTTASIAEYNKLKQQADTILNEDANHVETANRASQADIDGLVTKLQAALIDNQAAIAELDAKAQEKVTAAQQSKKVTQDEVAALVTKINNDKNNAIAEINKQTTAQGVTTEKDNGIAVLEQDVITPTVKPQANQAIEAKAEDTKESIDHSDQLTAEEKTEALAMIKQIKDQAKQGITDATTTAEVEKAKAQGLEAFDNIQIDSTEKQKAIEELETALDQIEAGVNVDADATTEEKEAFTNALEDILSKATEDISDQTTNAEIATVKNSALEQLKAQRINPVVKKNALEAIREVVNKQIEIIKNADADASAKEIARTDLGRYFDRFADKLDKTQTNTEVAELQNVTIPAIEAIVPQNDPNANDTNSGSDNNDATANSNANATPENTGQPNVTESTDNGKADASPTTPNNSDPATGETTATDDANNKPTANNNSSVDESADNSATGNGTTDKPEVESTNNGTTDKPATETDNATPAESTTNNNSTTATNENAPTGSTATAPTTNASTGAASSADSKDNASVNDSKQNAEVNNSAESQSTNGKVAQPKSENKAKAEKDGRDSTNQSMVESTAETLPSADITEPKVSSNTSKDKKESTTNQTGAGQLKSETNVASNEADKSEGNVDTEVSNKPSISKPSEAKDKATSTEDSQKADMSTADTKDNQASIGATADVNNKATQNDGANASPATVSKGSNSANQGMLKVTNTDKHQAKVTSAQQGKVNKPKQQAKTLPDTGMSHNDDLPYAELALGAGMAFLIRRFTKKDQQTEE
ncbi:TPA: SasC/FmtB family protein [Staphylococcus aureus]|nr:DUF1542 domain-containing protein [Staphylococcus aureus]